MEEGKYIYCIIGVDNCSENGENGKGLTFGNSGIGGRGDALYTVFHDGLGAVVSNAPIMKYQVTRENTITHEKAIEEVMQTHTVLPVRFCTIAGDEDKVKKILEKEYDRFRTLLESLSHKKELGIKAIFRDNLIYQYILEHYHDIRKLKDDLAHLPQDKTYYQRMEIGKMVETALQNERNLCRDSIMGGLSPLAIEAKMNSTYGEMMILNAAFLVHEKDEPMFDAKVNELAESKGDMVRFKYIGKVPPFNFVNLTIRTDEY